MVGFLVRGGDVMDIWNNFFDLLNLIANCSALVLAALAYYNK